jgi:hypothetical protein
MSIPIQPELKEHALIYAERRRINIIADPPLGGGIDGQVWSTTDETAVKAFLREHNYVRERDCYRRLREHSVTNAHRFTVPKLVSWDDELLIVEMQIVSPPFLLDFGKAYLDHPPDFDEQTMADDEELRTELFGSRWPEVKSAVSSLERYGIFYVDAKPGNVMFGDESTTTSL